MADLRIRRLERPADFEGCVDIQRRIWNHADLDITPVHNFCASVEAGGIVLGAFAGSVLAGYVYSFPAIIHGRTAQHSHHLAVRTEYQGLGLGKTLKWAQRDEVLRRGLKLITWTYDPLQARNANLNLHNLGAIGRTYLDDFYGPAESLTLEPGVPTDRLLVEWEIASRRVEERSPGSPAAGAARLDPEALPKAVAQRPDGFYPRITPRRPDFTRGEPVLLVEVPRSIRDLKGLGGLIAAWQKSMRAAFIHYLKTGYVLDDFIFGDRAYYVLRRT